MKILVVEDNATHLEAAKEALQEHELTTATSFKEAAEKLSEEVDYTLLCKLCADEGAPEPLPQSGGNPKFKDEWERFLKCKERLEETARRRPQFEAVLSDLHIPMWYSSDDLLSYGFVIALRAARLASVKWIAVVTDINHHKGGMATALDEIAAPYYPFNEDTKKWCFFINGKICHVAHAPFLRNENQNDNTEIKDWKRILDDLLQITLCT